MTPTAAKADRHGREQLRFDEPSAIAGRLLSWRSDRPPVAAPLTLVANAIAPPQGAAKIKATVAAQSLADGLDGDGRPWMVCRLSIAVRHGLPGSHRHDGPPAVARRAGASGSRPGGEPGLQASLLAPRAGKASASGLPAQRVGPAVRMPGCFVPGGVSARGLAHAHGEAERSCLRGRTDACSSAGARREVALGGHRVVDPVLGSGADSFVDRLCPKVVGRGLPRELPAHHAVCIRFGRHRSAPRLVLGRERPGRS